MTSRCLLHSSKYILLLLTLSKLLIHSCKKRCFFPVLDCFDLSDLFVVFQGLAFTLEERQVLGIHGLQPGRFKSQEEQIELCKISINRYQEDLNKYLYLIDLQVSDHF